MQYIICPDSFLFGERGSKISPMQVTLQLKVLQKQNCWETMVCGVKKKSCLRFLEVIAFKYLNNLVYLVQLRIKLIDFNIAVTSEINLCDDILVVICDVL